MVSDRSADGAMYRAVCAFFMKREMPSCRLTCGLHLCRQGFTAVDGASFKNASEGPAPRTVPAHRPCARVGRRQGGIAAGVTQQ